MRIKVCGMKYPDNIKELATNRLPIDYMGMIFYDKSPRFAKGLNLSDLNTLPDYIKRVGVFVNAETDYIMHMIESYDLDLLQLHGNETVEFCKRMNTTHPVIKAFSIASPTDFEQTKEYEDACDYFLFDTKTEQYGGSGKKFDWNILNNYNGNIPFYLSGGISAEDVDIIRAINHSQFCGVDLNSKFEIHPGLKDIELLNQFIKALRYEQN